MYSVGNRKIDKKCIGPCQDTLKNYPETCKLSCDCHKECKIDSCICVTNNLNCTDACHLLACDSVEEDYYFSNEDELE